MYLKIRRLVTGTLESNGYIVYGEGGSNCFIIDPGYEPESYIQQLETLGLKVAGILLTHHHYDHVGAVRDIADKYKCPVYLHKNDCDIYGEQVDIPLEDEMEISIGNEVIRVIHTPGHTEGSVCYYAGKCKLVFTGDTIFNVDLGRTDLEDGSPEKMIRSVANIISKWSNDITIYPGHGDPATMEYVRAHNREYLDIVQRMDTVKKPCMVVPDNNN